MNKDIENKKIDSFRKTRYAFVSLFELILFTIFLSLIIVTSMHTPFTTSLKQVSLKQQEIRAISIFFGYVYLTTYIVFIIYACLKKENSKFEKISIGMGFIPVIGIINLIYYFFKSMQEKTVIMYIKHIFSSTNINKEICYKHLFSSIKNKNIKKNDSLFWTTFIFSIVFLVSVVSLIFIFLRLDHTSDPTDPRALWWFRKFSYFTEWSNFSCFLVCFLFLLNHRWKIFNNGKFINSIAIYILFVFIVFWLVLLPGAAILNNNLSLSGKKVSEIISTGWFHLIMPLSYALFVAFYNAFWKDFRSIKMQNYYKTIFYFPLTYCCYAYTLSFVANISIYGLMTNANPNNTPFGDKHPGEYWHFAFIPMLLIVFAFLIWAFLSIAKKISIKMYKNAIPQINN